MYMYICAHVEIYSPQPRERKYRWNTQLRLNRITISFRFGFPHFILWFLFVFKNLQFWNLCTYLRGLTLNNKQGLPRTIAFISFFNGKFIYVRVRISIRIYKFEFYIRYFPFFKSFIWQYLPSIKQACKFSLKISVWIR